MEGAKTVSVTIPGNSRRTNEGIDQQQVRAGKRKSRKGKETVIGSTPELEPNLNAICSEAIADVNSDPNLVPAKSNGSQPGAR